MAEQEGDISEGEQKELDAWKATLQENAAFYDRCQDDVEVAKSLAAMAKYNKEASWQRLTARIGLNGVPVKLPAYKRSWYWMVAAATLLVLATALVLWLVNQKTPQAAPVVEANKGENILPGANKATLTLSDGRTILLEDQQNGVLTEDQGVAVRKQGEMLEYKTGSNKGGNPDVDEPMAYNTARTARGSFIALTLPDNSKVWLNADASLRFPVRFSGDERRVELTGEAYFEVAKQPSKPFIVATADAEVRVLGTHFNVRSYGEEGKLLTTLLEGKVEVKAMATRSKVVLKPAQQAIVGENKPGIEVTEVETETIIAWKNGLFDFKATPLKEILQEVKRWYPGIDAIEMPKPIDERFTATVSRNLPLSKLFEILEATQKVHFEVRGKTIYVAE